MWVFLKNETPLPTPSGIKCVSLFLFFTMSMLIIVRYNGAGGDSLKSNRQLLINSYFLIARPPCYLHYPKIHEKSIAQVETLQTRVLKT